MCNIEVHKEAKGSAEDQGWPWHSELVDSTEDGRGLPFQGKTVQCSTTDVQIRVCRRHNKDQDYSIDHMLMIEIRPVR